MVDSAEFHTNLDTMKTYEQGETIGTIAELMMEQVRTEYFSENISFNLMRRLSSLTWWCSTRGTW